MFAGAVMQLNTLASLPSESSFFKWGESYPSCSEDMLVVLDDLSRYLIKSAEAKIYPDLVSFAFFCRRSNLEQVISRIILDKNLEKMRGVGTLFHITPSNIPMNFALSFLFGFLSGNTNIVKAPISKFAQAKIFVDAWHLVSEGTDFFESNWFCDFSRSDSNIESFVARADGLLVWGGDQTIQSVRQLRRKPEAIAWEFPDKYSIAMFSAQAVSQSKGNELKLLAEHFYNDTLLVDQNACSSPSLIIWVGSANEAEIARQSFWPEFEKFVASKRKTIDLESKITRSVYLAKLGTINQNIQSNSDWYGNVVFAWADELSLIDLTESRPKLGLFLEGKISKVTDLRECKGLLGPKLQTVSVFGLDHVSVRAVLHGEGAGERVVSVGQALAYSLMWDGKNAIHQLSKIVE